MREVQALLDDMFVTQERMSRDEIYRRAVAAEAPIEVINALDGLPEGEYALDEVTEAVGQISEPAPMPEFGVPANQLNDDDLMRELAEIHRTRNDTLRHGSDHALATHDQRMGELEGEYLRRFPQREIDPARLRPIEETAEVERAVEDDVSVPSLAPRTPRTGAEQQWDPEDLVIATGRDPTPENLEWARRKLAEEGPSAIERTVP